MSDTPLDRELEVKTSTRMPEFLNDRIEEFREEYNEVIEEAFDGNDEALEQFKLESRSDALRRLVDTGLTHITLHGIPTGFQFDPEEYGSEGSGTHCPDCYEDDPSLIRVKGKNFDMAECLSCGAERPVEEMVDEPLL